jgi:amino acid transporter
MNKSSSASPGLIRALGPLLATAVVIGTVIGSGVFKKPAAIAQSVPYFGMAALVWVLGGVLVLLGALAYAEIAVLFPKAGGNYVFLREGYGRLAGFLWGWVEFWIIRSASLAALATVFTESFHNVLTNPSFQKLVGLPEGSRLEPWMLQLLTVAVLLFLAAVNVRGVKWGGVLQLLITLVKVGSLLAILLLPFVFLARGAAGPGGTMPHTENLEPIWPAAGSAIALGGLGSALLGVLWAYHGWMNIAWVAEEVRQPQRNLPLSLLGGVGIIIFLYLGANLAYALVMPASVMANLDPETTVATAFSERLLGPMGVVLASAAIMFSVFGALNGNLMVGPRMLYAMGEDGLAPHFLSRVHPTYHTPDRAIWVLTVWSCLLVVGGAALTTYGLPVLDVAGVRIDLNVPKGKSLFDILTDFAMFGAVIFETMAIVSIFIFRWKLPNADRPYRCVGYPVVPALYVILPGFVLVNMFQNQRIEAVTGVAFIALGTLVYSLIPSRGAGSEV